MFPIHWASQIGHSEVVRLLLEKAWLVYVDSIKFPFNELTETATLNTMYVLDNDKDTTTLLYVNSLFRSRKSLLMYAAQYNHHWCTLHSIITIDCTVRGGADKFLAWPGRKQATATRLGIYSTYSQRSSIHFLTRWSNFCKPLKKEFRKLSVQPCLRGSNDLRVRRKMATFQLFFQSREQVVVRWGQIRRIGWVIKTLEA